MPDRLNSNTQWKRTMIRFLAVSAAAKAVSPTCFWKRVPTHFTGYIRFVLEYWPKNYHNIIT